MLDCGNESLAIDARELTKKYGKNLATDRLDISIQRGRTFGLLGPNGAGKSTAIRMLMGLTEIDSGSANVLGLNVKDQSTAIRKRIGYVPELHFMYRWMTVAEIIRFVGALYDRWDDDLANDLLSRFELARTKKVKELSKGMAAKLGLVVALAHRPELLILDEPTSGLDPIIREDFLESMLRSDTELDRTVLFSSHHVDDVERLADEVGIMVNGRLVMCGGVDQLRRDVKRVRVVLRDGTLPSSAPPETVFQKLNRREWTVTLYPFHQDVIGRIKAENVVENVDVMDLSLEDIFKDVVRGKNASSKETNS